MSTQFGLEIYLHLSLGKHPAPVSAKILIKLLPKRPIYFFHHVIRKTPNFETIGGEPTPPETCLFKSCVAAHIKDSSSSQAPDQAHSQCRLDDAGSEHLLVQEGLIG